MSLSVPSYSLGRINHNGNSNDLNIWSISTLDTVEFEENNRILLRKVNFVFMIPNPSLDCSYVVLNFWPNSVQPRCSYKIILIKKRIYDIFSAG